MAEHPKRPPYSDSQIPALEKEVARLRKKLLREYPDATPEQLEVAIGNALKVANPRDKERVEEITRHHLGYLP
ncbi:hypothetical protein OVA24_17765 [Luteolibacter sp. SL250]|uniref:hypothetical protein n=1 Tax=Luteolibacter sp. SL250 TaxID=2995170 RepID=UPI00226ECAC6|nr:hypothetical protein [Luteolibacter sp. SL250]WAC19077.1 hypothetical protein OVA24_17765 [Luteolibacter sp. SL250]